MQTPPYVRPIVPFLTIVTILTLFTICPIDRCSGNDSLYPLTLASNVSDEDNTRECDCTSSACPSDRLWVISTRMLSSDVCRANLVEPSLAISRLECGRLQPSSLEEYLGVIANKGSVAIYVHGNRLRHCEALRRGSIVHAKTGRFRTGGPIDWVIWSWPSEQSGMLTIDFRIKADRTDAQGLYLAWLLRQHAALGTPTALIGYSFGGRVITGSLHALAGGRLGGRSLPGEAITGMRFDAGLVAPAIDSNWMTQRGYHGLATKNLDSLLVMYNRRDAVLKRYWWLERARGRLALGYTGPTGFAPRADGTKLSVRGHDCSTFLGLAHVELDYYSETCRAGAEMANLIHDVHFTH